MYLLIECPDGGQCGSSVVVAMMEPCKVDEYGKELEWQKICNMANNNTNVLEFPFQL